MENGQIDPNFSSVPNVNKTDKFGNWLEGLNRRQLATAVIIASLILGLLGGAGGSYYLLTSARGQQILQKSGSKMTQQTLAVNEDSAVIDVVKNSSPAVVSIIISKELSKISSSPFNYDPFYYYFYGQGSQNQQQNNSQNNSGEKTEVGAGSGFLVSADGLIITNKHVISDSSASYTVVMADGKKYDAKIVAEDPVNDLAIVKIDIQNAPYLKLADSEQIQIGQRVVAIGNTLGLYQNTVTAGIISGKGRKITAGSDTGTEQLSNVIQTDAAISEGNSGGPLLNLSGEVIGINTAIDEQGQSVGFALPANDIAKALASYQKSGKIVRPYLGVRYITITADLAKSESLPKSAGALIVRGDTKTELAVIPGSPADKAGLVENDIILEVDGKTVDEDNTLSDLLKNYNVGDTVKLNIYHKGQEKTVNVTLGESK